MIKTQKEAVVGDVKIYWTRHKQKHVTLDAPNVIDYVYVEDIRDLIVALTEFADTEGL